MSTTDPTVIAHWQRLTRAAQGYRSDDKASANELSEAAKAWAAARPAAPRTAAPSGLTIPFGRSKGGDVMPYVGKSMDRKRDARRRQLSGAHTAESWNAAHPVGTAVRYWPIYPPSEGFPPEDTTTRSEAWTLGDGSVVVLVSGKTGGVHLSHVEVLP